MTKRIPGTRHSQEVAGKAVAQLATEQVAELKAEIERLRKRGGCEHRIFICGACLTEFCDGCRSYQCPHESKAAMRVPHA